MCLAWIEPNVDIFNIILASQAQELEENVSKRFIHVLTNKEVAIDLIGELRKLKEEFI